MLQPSASINFLSKDSVAMIMVSSLVRALQFFVDFFHNPLTNNRLPLSKINKANQPLSNNLTFFFFCFPQISVLFCRPLKLILLNYSTTFLLQAKNSNQKTSESKNETIISL